MNRQTGEFTSTTMVKIKEAVASMADLPQVASDAVGMRKTLHLFCCRKHYWNGGESFFRGQHLLKGNFQPNHAGADGQNMEVFKSSSSVKGCTVAAVAKEITALLDEKEVNVTDTVDYHDSFFSATNLTEVMDQFEETTAVVVVLNSLETLV